MASSHENTAKLGSHIALGALLLQIMIFGFFIVVSLVFHRRLRARPSNQSHDPSLPWEKFLYILYITSAFIMIRSVVRVAEFIEGFEGTILTHEVFLYVLDAVPMAAVMVVFNIWYPSNLSKRARNVIMDRESADSNVELSNAELQSKNPQTVQPTLAKFRPWFARRTCR